MLRVQWAHLAELSCNASASMLGKNTRSNWAAWARRLIKCNKAITALKSADELKQ